MKKLAKEVRVHPGEAVDLKRRPALVKPVYQSKSEYQQLLDEHVAHLSALQELLYATNRHALLIIFQAMEHQARNVRRQSPRLRCLYLQPPDSG